MNKPLIKKCLHCQRTYLGQPTGRHSQVCPLCTLECEEAYPKILKHISVQGTHKQVMDKDLIAAALNVPAIFIGVLIAEGRFGPVALKAEDCFCKHCQAHLLRKESELCSMCQSRRSKQLTHALQSQKRVLQSNPTQPGTGAANPHGFNGR